jgi:ubiquinone/menaquinone biosynthesis C-methylase UbiE
MYLHHVESPLNAIKEMVRMLKPEEKYSTQILMSIALTF